MFFLLRTTLPGVARRLLTFLVSPRKVSKRSDRWVVAPSGVPGVGRYKSGRENNSLRSDIFPFFFRFIPAATGYSQAAKLPRLLAFGFALSNVQRCLLGRRPSERWDPVASAHRSSFVTTLGSNFRWNDKAKETNYFPPRSLPWRCAASQSRSPLESSRRRQVQIGLRREKCLSEASCFPFPIFTRWHREPRRGYDPAVAFLCLLSLAKQRK